MQQILIRHHEYDWPVSLAVLLHLTSLRSNQLLRSLRVLVRLGGPLFGFMLSSLQIRGSEKMVRWTCFSPSMFLLAPTSMIWYQLHEQVAITSALWSTKSLRLLTYITISVCAKNPMKSAYSDKWQDPCETSCFDMFWLTFRGMPDFMRLSCAHGDVWL
jgi:hypothetical protein